MLLNSTVFVIRRVKILCFVFCSKIKQNKKKHASNLKLYCENLNYILFEKKKKKNCQQYLHLIQIQDTKLKMIQISSHIQLNV